MKHTILGAGGSIGNALAFELLKANENVRLVSRSNYSIPGTESFKANITSYEETLKSVQNSDVVYLCAGLAYDLNVWLELWPKIMQNAIDACKKVNAKLIFFASSFTCLSGANSLTRSVYISSVSLPFGSLSTVSPFFERNSTIVEIPMLNSRAALLSLVVILTSAILLYTLSQPCHCIEKAEARVICRKIMIYYSNSVFKMRITSLMVSSSRSVRLTSS